MARLKNSQADAATTTTSPTRVTVQTTSLALVRNTASSRNNPSSAAPIPAAKNESVTVPELVSMLANDSQGRFNMAVVPSDPAHPHYGATLTRWPPRPRRGRPHPKKHMKNQSAVSYSQDSLPAPMAPIPAYSGRFAAPRSAVRL